MKNEAEAQGAKILVDALGTPQRTTRTSSPRTSSPESELIFAGPGTFWTDLKSFQDIGASKVLEQSQQQEKTPTTQK